MHDEGKTQLDGRTVERIRIDTAPSSWRQLSAWAGHLYVDPETFYPVEIVATVDQVEIVGGPGTSSYSHVRVRDVTRYLTFEYLPPDRRQPRTHRHPRTTPERDRTVAAARGPTNACPPASPNRGGEMKHHRMSRKALTGRDRCDRGDSLGDDGCDLGHGR